MSRQIGEQLARARQAQSLSLEKVSQETYIRLHYLQALEEGDFGALPSVAQARGFLRAYAGYLGLDADRLLAGITPQEDLEGSPVEPAPSQPETRHQTDSATASAIFHAIGEQLRNQRELLGFSLDDVEQHTHVRTHYLASLESGQIVNLPSPVQGRGMLNNYSRFLGLDPDPLLLQFAEGLQAQHASKMAAEKSPPPPRGLALPPWMRRLVSGDLIFGGILILGLATFVIWAAIRITAIRSEEVPRPTAPPIAEVILASPSATAMAANSSPNGVSTGAPPPLPDEGEESTPETVPLFSGQGAVQVYVLVQQRAWMRATVDGQVEFEGRVLPGSAYQFAGEDRVEILSGNGAALRVFFNQQDLGLLGILGEVVDRVFTVEGIATPTASPTPTSTDTPRISPTPANTGTITPSPPSPGNP